MDEKLREAYAELHASVKAMLSWRNGTVKTGLGYIRDTDGSRDQIQLVADALDRIKSLERAQPAASQVECKGRKSIGGCDPQDCDWPFCDCDPAANRVIEALQESGFEIRKVQPVAAQGTDEQQEQSELAETMSQRDKEAISHAYDSAQTMWRESNALKQPLIKPK